MDYDGYFIRNKIWRRLMYIPRMAHSQITEALKFFPVILLTGARQVGKSTLALKLSHISNLRMHDNWWFSRNIEN